MIRILVIDDHPVVREGFAAILAAEPDFDVVGQAAEGREALALLDRLHPDVVLVDLRLPRMTGLVVCQTLAKHHPGIRVLVLTSYPSRAALDEARRAGAHGLLAKTTDRVVLCKAVRAVAMGRTVFDPEVAESAALRRAKRSRAKGPFGLTVQELRVLQLVPGGYTNHEIARFLGISPETVKSHLAHAMRKLKVRDRTEAGAVAIREGLA